MAGNKEFLSHFPPEHRGAVGNWFHEAARGGAKDPRPLCSAVFRYLSRQQEQEGEAGGGVDKAAVLSWMRQDREGALALAAYVIWYAALPPSEQSRLKQHSQDEGKKEWARDRPPTDKQKALLARLGHAGPIESMAHASELIERLKDW